MKKLGSWGTLPEKVHLWHSVNQGEEAGESLLHMSARGRPYVRNATHWSGLTPQIDGAYISLRVLKGPEHPPEGAGELWQRRV